MERVTCTDRAGLAFVVAVGAFLAFVVAGCFPVAHPSASASSDRVSAGGLGLPLEIR